MARRESHEMGWKWPGPYRPLHVDVDKFRSNYDRIDWSNKQPPPAPLPTEAPEETLKELSSEADWDH